MYRIVCVQHGYLAKVEEGWLYEIPEDYIVRNRKFPGIASLENCENLQDVRDLLSDIGNDVFRFSADTLTELLSDLAFRNDNDAWYERNPEIQIFQRKNKFFAVVYLDEEPE